MEAYLHAWFSESWKTWCGRTILLMVLCVAIECSPVPRKYLREADPKVTLTTIVAAPDLYQNKLVVLGGVILEEEMQDGRLWLHTKNRPLDQDYRPQLPPSVDDPEVGVVLGRRREPSAISSVAPLLGRHDCRRSTHRHGAWERTDVLSSLCARVGASIHP